MTPSHEQISAAPPPPHAIRDMAIAIGWSYRSIARRLGVNEATVRGWAGGKRHVPDGVVPWLARIAAIVDAIGLPFGWDEDGETDVLLDEDALCLADAAQEIDWSYREIARRLNVHEVTVRQWANGRRNAPPAVIAWLNLIATMVYAIGLPPGWRLAASDATVDVLVDA